MQAVLALWEQGLHATGRALVLEKSFWYLMDFWWQGCKWRYAAYATELGELLMKDTHIGKNQYDGCGQMLPNAC